MSRIAAILAAVFVAAQIGRALVLNETAPELTRGGTPFLIQRIPAGTVISQSFNVRTGALEGIHVEGDIAHAEGAAAVEARLFEVSADGSDRLLRRATVTLTGAGDECCRFSFERLENSTRRRYRVDLETFDMDAAAGFSLRAVPARQEGELIINGHPQPANLVIAVDGARLAPWRGLTRIPTFLILACFAIVDAGVLRLVYALLTASDRRPS